MSLRPRSSGDAAIAGYDPATPLQPAPTTIVPTQAPSHGASRERMDELEDKTKAIARDLERKSQILMLLEQEMQVMSVKMHRLEKARSADPAPRRLIPPQPQPQMRPRHSGGMPMLPLSRDRLLDENQYLREQLMLEKQKAALASREYYDAQQYDDEAEAERW